MVKTEYKITAHNFWIKIFIPRKYDGVKLCTNV